MAYLLGIPLLVVGLVVGMYLPDLDQRLPFLLHRSILTHNAFLPLLLACFLRRKKRPALCLLTIGLCGALAVHLAFDLFPNSWAGYALISLPFFGRGPRRSFRGCGLPSALSSVWWSPQCSCAMAWKWG
jgi:hypothetical protein